VGKNLEAMERFLERCQSGDMEAACKEYLTEDFECHEPPSLPQRGVFKGQDAPLRISAIYRGIWDVSVDDTRLWEVEGDDVVVARYLMTWTSKKTGKSMTQPVLEANHFRDGKVAKMEIFHFDPVGLVSTLE